jgi:hypothetical protein
MINRENSADSRYLCKNGNIQGRTNRIQRFARN